MGEWYEFDFIFNGNDWVAGCVFRSKDSNFNAVMQIELTNEQKQEANDWMQKLNDLHLEREIIIKRFIAEAANPIEIVKERE